MRTSVQREHRGITSGTVRTMRVSLSKGDGSSGCTCDLSCPIQMRLKSLISKNIYHMQQSVETLYPLLTQLMLNLIVDQPIVSAGVLPTTTS